MNATSGKSLPMVSAFTSHALCLMPRTLIHVSVAVTAVSIAVRGQSAVITGQ
jgi:hypothetical protein